MFQTLAGILGVSELLFSQCMFAKIYNLSYYTTHNIVPNHGTIAKC